MNFPLDISPQMLMGGLFLVLAMAVGYMAVMSNKGTDDPIDPSSNSKGEEAEEMDKNFAEYLEKEKAQQMKESEDILAGQTEKYEWQQNARELDMYIPLAAGQRSRDITCAITATSLSVSISGEIILEGTFAGEVIPVECNWQIGNLVTTEFDWCT